MPPEITYKTLKTLIQYMYCGETTVSNDILESVLRGGDILQVRGLWRPRTETPVNTKPDNTLSRTPVKVIQKPNNVLKLVDSNIKTTDLAEKKQMSKNSEKVIKECSSEPKTKSDRPSHVDENKQNNKAESTNSNLSESETGESEKSKDDINYLVIKEEPMEWNEFQEVEMNESEMFHTEMTIKPEIIFPSEETEYRPESEELYSPLTCELCSETFTLPAEWVRHIRTHTDMQPAKRRRGGRSLPEDEDNFPPLQCDLCQKQFPTPGEWVRHIQNTHTDTELAESNNSTNAKARISKPVGSNLLRHLRTLHDKIINSADVNLDVKSE
ncbi:uncharacterized protein CBL_05688 [Carabus blaptoides fortunei]